MCITVGPEIRYRTTTRTRLLSLSPGEQRSTLRELYRHNAERLFNVISFCRQNGIQLYRVTSNLFPFNDMPAGTEVLEEFRKQLAPFGKTAERQGIRIVLHPDQFVVLNSLKPGVVDMSVGIMERHAYVFDLLGLSRSPWAAMILHGGKSGRGAELVELISRLPAPIRNRLILENDESAFGAAEILDICRKAGVPMVFDLHHHAVKEKLSSYEDPSMDFYLREAQTTWPHPDWQIVHISNGADSFGDPCHSDFIRTLPKAIWAAPWIEVEAKNKEEAIRDLRQRHPALVGLKGRPIQAPGCFELLGRRHLL